MDIRLILAAPWAYNLLQNLMGAKRNRRMFVSEHVRPPKGARILDIGCGTAQLLSFLPTNVCYIGYDPSQNYISHARALHGKRGEFYVGFFDGAAAKRHSPSDLILACGLLHHMSDEQVVELMRLAYQSLVPGGRLVTLDPVFCIPQHPLARWLIKMDRGQYVRSAEKYGSPGITVLATTYSGMTQFMCTTDCDQPRKIWESQKYSNLASQVFGTIESVIKHNNRIAYSHWIMECEKSSDS